MSLLRQVRTAFEEWSATHTGFIIDELIVNFHTPKDGPGDVVMVIVGLDAGEVYEWDLRELRNRVARIARSAGIGPVVISVRTLDSGMVIAGRRRRDSTVRLR